MKKRKLVVLSADAMIPEDVEYLSNKPFVQKILKEGVWINSLRTVYPANTYPCHASMITGCYPDKTGVDTNYYKGTKTWRAERDNIQVKTLIDYAKENGYKKEEVLYVGDDFGDGGGDSHIRLGGIDYVNITDYTKLEEELKYLY